MNRDSSCSAKWPDSKKGKNTNKLPMINLCEMFATPLPNAQQCILIVHQATCTLFNPNQSFDFNHDFKIQPQFKWNAACCCLRYSSSGMKITCI